MTRAKAYAIAVKLMTEQLENTMYSLERDEYSDLLIEDIEAICEEINSITLQFKMRYKSGVPTK